MLEGNTLDIPFTFDTSNVTRSFNKLTLDAVNYNRPLEFNQSMNNDYAFNIAIYLLNNEIANIQRSYSSTSLELDANISFTNLVPDTTYIIKMTSFATSNSLQWNAATYPTLNVETASDNANISITTITRELLNHDAHTKFTFLYTFSSLSDIYQYAANVYNNNDNNTHIGSANVDKTLTSSSFSINTVFDYFTDDANISVKIYNYDIEDFATTTSPSIISSTGNIGSIKCATTSITINAQKQFALTFSNSSKFSFLNFPGFQPNDLYRLRISYTEL